MTALYDIQFFLQHYYYNNFPDRSTLKPVLIMSTEITSMGQPQKLQFSDFFLSKRPFEIKPV